MTTVNIKIVLPGPTYANESYGSLSMLIASKIDYSRK